MTKAILLAGVEKTGTTSLQKFFAANRDALARQGVAYPRFCGRFNHIGLAAYALEDGRRDPTTRAVFRDDETPEAFRRRLRGEASQELSGADVTLFCNEHCHSRLKTVEEIQRLKGFLSNFFDEIDVYLYLRRQDRLAVSLYSTEIKSGGTRRSIIPITSENDRFFNYELSLDMWAHIFGEGAVHPRIYERRLLHGGDVIADFLSVLAIAERDLVHVPEQNPSLRPDALEFLRRTNAALNGRRGDGWDGVGGIVADALSKAFPGRGPKPARSDARAFLELAARESLFDDDFSEYPELEAPASLDIDAAIAIAGELVRGSIMEQQRLESEVALRDARIAEVQQDSPGVARACRRAISRSPGNQVAYRRLCRALLDVGRHAEAKAALSEALEKLPGDAELLALWNETESAGAEQGRVAG